MLYDGEKLRIPSANEWPQNMGEMLRIPGNNNCENNNNNNNNNKNKNNASTATSNSNSSTGTNNNMIHAAAAAAPPPAGRVMDKPAQDQQAALKCPRCDSSNTKFCYYNNYSLSQPRHFCKACKRYWTRGGTLRNVPVGGGCRKNKRVKKPTSNTASDPLPSALLPPTNNSVPSISLPNPTSHLDPPMNPLFYSLPAASSSPSSSSDMGLAFSGLRTPSVPHSISIPCTGFDLQPLQLNSLGLGFPSSQSQSQSQSQRDDEFHLSHLQTSASVMNDYPLFGSTAASLLLSSLKHPKKLEDYQTLMPYEDLQAASAEANGNLEVIKEVKLEGEANAINNSRIEWQIPFDTSFDAIVPAASTSLAGDSSFLYWNSAIGGAWPDSANCGSSVAPLI